MEERAIHISSVYREKRGTSRPGDFKQSSLIHL